jgi:hypothetical protein
MVSHSSCCHPIAGWLPILSAGHAHPGRTVTGGFYPGACATEF